MDIHPRYTDSANYLQINSTNTCIRIYTLTIAVSRLACFDNNEIKNEEHMLTLFNQVKNRNVYSFVGQLVDVIPFFRFHSKIKRSASDP